MPAPHPTQVFLHHPSGLRVELRLDDGRLILWWSPLAGSSFNCADRNYSNRDDHLEVLESIALAGIGLTGFRGCDYDATRATLRFDRGELVVELGPDRPIVLLSAGFPLTVDLKAHRHDRQLAWSSTGWLVGRSEPRFEVDFAVAVGPGAGSLRSAPMHAPGNARHAWATLAPGQVLAVGVGLRGERVDEATGALAARPLGETRAAVEARLAADLRQGTPSFADPRLDALYAATRRSLHGAIDDSGAIRASLKPVYYLIWLRDGAFCFNYQAAAGWMHRHDAWCRFVLANPTRVAEPGLPDGFAFAQLVNRTYGKLEEDGLYYATWSVFTAAVQSGRTRPIEAEVLATLREALRWLETYAFDTGRGLFASRFADESPVRLCRDHGIDAAIGARSPERGITLRGKPIARLHDTYLNTLCFGVYGMLAALPGVPADFAEECRAKAGRLWRELRPFFAAHVAGPDAAASRPSVLPSYGEVVLESGERLMAPPYEPIRSVYVWAFCLPGLAPIPGIDAIRLALLRDLMASPRLHWINGIAALVASVDPLACDPAELHDVIAFLAAQAERAGTHLPMPGTMPEKVDAPDGSLHDDIRPQAFAQSAFLAACASLGIRRLPFGLAVRPTGFIRAWQAYAWRGSELDLTFGAEAPGVMVDGRPLPGSLQLPDACIPSGRVAISVGPLPAGPVLARSNVALHDVALDGETCVLDLTAHGPSELVFTRRPATLAPEPPLAVSWAEESGLAFARFDHVGRLSVRFG